MPSETKRERLLERLWRIERGFVSKLPSPLKRPYLEASKFVAANLGLHDLRFPVSSPRFGEMMVNRVDTVNFFIYFFGVWEPRISALIESYLEPGDVFVDVGANVGYYSLCAAKLVGPTGRVYALEASPSIYERLCDHIERNELRNTEPVHCAVWDTEAELDIFLGPTKNEGNTSLQEGLGRVRESRVHAAPLSSLIPHDDLDRVRIVKIDVEGAETQVIRGTIECLDRMPEGVMFLIEVTKSLMRQQGGSVTEALEPFESRGFRFFAIPNDYSFGFYLRHSESAPLVEEISYSKIVDGPEARFDLAVTRTDLVSRLR
ncbi:MAG: FkbM family methyltransferase [Polyangiales bacterium]